MTLTDGEVAALARQAVDRLDPTIDLAIEPATDADPYARGEAAWLVWPLLDGHRAFGVHLYGRDTAADSLARLLDGLSENSSESARFWARPFPQCPGHAHPANIRPDGSDVVLTCPESGVEVERIRPVTG